MEKHIPYEKLSKKQKRQLDAQKRGSWGSINPVTRKPKNSKAYDRSKARQWKKDYHHGPCSFFIMRQPTWGREETPSSRSMLRTFPSILSF